MISKSRITKALKDLRQHLAELTSEDDRFALFMKIIEGYCRSCGSQLTKERPNCYCRYDE